MSIEIGSEKTPKSRPGGRVPSLCKSRRRETSRKEVRIPDELPEEALRLPPSMRRKLWNEAVQTVNLDGDGDFAEIMEWFTWLCRLTVFGAVKLGSAQILDFIDECLDESQGAKSSASEIYEAFVKWWGLYGQGPAPGPKTLAEYLRMRFKAYKSAGIWYRDCLVRKNATA